MTVKSEIENPKSEIENGLSFPVMETFYSIQGEGFHSGTPAFFIRLGGCNVNCHWCDTKESWSAENHPVKPVGEIVSEAGASGAKTAIITGGEPLMYNLNYLTKKLKEKTIKTLLETSGAHTITGVWDWICLSPKKFKEPLAEIYPLANELKIIIYNKDDFHFAEENARRMNGCMDEWMHESCNSIIQSFNHATMQSCHLFLQPEWSKREQMFPLIIDYVRRNPKWRISLQSHKYMGIP